MIRKPKKIELKMHDGCEGCVKKCLYNSKCATPNVAKESEGKKFPCNSSKEK